jgi:hypothetical protein
MAAHHDFDGALAPGHLTVLRANVARRQVRINAVAATRYMTGQVVTVDGGMALR